MALGANEREFWTIAQSFPVDKEMVYPDHTIAQEFAHHRGKTVLEYGCGGGSDTISYLRRGCRVYFADIVPSNVTVTHKRVLEAGYAGKAKPLVLKTSDALDGLPSGHCDVVSAHGVLHHVSTRDTVMRILGEFRRVLDSKGKLYVMLYTRELWDRYEVARGKLELKGLSPAQAFGQLTDGEGCPFAMAYDEQDGRLLLQSAGFNVESTFMYNNDDFRTYRAVLR